MRRRPCAALLLMAVLLPVVGLAGPAAAGGSPLYAVKDRYEPGDTVVLVGYDAPLPAGWEARGPYHAYLQSSPGQAPADRGVLVGTPSIVATGASDWTAYRVSLRFTLPDGLPVGRYEVDVCDATCSAGLGDLSASVPIPVGVDPAGDPAPRAWPLTEPEIGNLAPDAVVAGPGYQVTAAEARSLLASPPSSVPPPTVVTASEPPPSLGSPIGDFLVPVPVTRRSADPWALLSGAIIALTCVGTVVAALRRVEPSGGASGGQAAAGRAFG